MTRLSDTFPERTAVLLREVLMRVEAMGEEALRGIGISGREYGLLTMLSFSANAGSQRRVGEALGLDRTTTMKLMVDLTARGLVDRSPHPRDRRSYRITVTGEGRKVVADADRVLAACDDAITAGRLDEAEVAVLRDLLTRLLKDDGS